MQLINTKNTIDFMSKRKLAMIVSIVLLVISIASLTTRGLNFGLDFSGGYLIEVGYDDVADLAAIRKTLANNGLDNAIVQNFGSAKDVLVRLAPDVESGEDIEAAKVSDSVLDILKTQNTAVKMRRVEYVGPQIGDELKNDGGIAMLLALLCIMVYVALRFEWKFSLGAVAALMHDVIITLGVFSILQADFDLTVLAAVLAVIGYSLNDTIVVYDRIRENFRKIRNGEPLDVTNTSVNQTLARTIMTSITTLLVLFSLFFLGGPIIHSFSLALIIGVLIGTYSSIFVASPIVLALGLTRDDLLPPKQEDEELASP